MAYEVETVNIGFLYPRLQAVSNLSWSSDQNWPIAPNADMLGDSVLGPL